MLIEVFDGLANDEFLVYPVDSASYMRSFWGHASYLLKVLVMRSIGYDDNGMELRFTNELDEKWRLMPTKNQKKEMFTKKMVSADPNKRKNKISKTDMSASLSLILEDHLRKNRDGEKLKRHLTILVLTDGLWELNDEHEVDDYLVTFIKRIPEESWEPETPLEPSRETNKPVSRPRPISIQFIRFGHHPKAIERLDRLDNHLKDRQELVRTSIPDIIDTEDANMDVYKMFLGSFIEDFDNKAIQGAPGVGSMSGRSVTSPTNGPDTSGMSQSEHEATHSLSYPQTPTSTGKSPPEMHRQSSVPGRPHLPWPSPPQTYPLSRVPRISTGPSLHIPDSPRTLAHYRQESGEYTASSLGSGVYGHYTRPRGESQGQYSKASSPLTPMPPYDRFSPS